MALLILFIAYALQVRYRPFLSPADRPDVLQDHVVKSLSGGPHALVAASLKTVDALRRKTTRVTRIGADGGECPGGRWTGAGGRWTVVGHVLCVGAIVESGGVRFLS